MTNILSQETNPGITVVKVHRLGDPRAGVRLYSGDRKMLEAATKLDISGYFEQSSALGGFIISFKCGLFS